MKYFTKKQLITELFNELEHRHVNRTTTHKQLGVVMRLKKYKNSLSIGVNCIININFEDLDLDFVTDQNNIDFPCITLNHQSDMTLQQLKLLLL